MFADLVRTRAALLGSNVACNDEATNKKERNGRAPSPVARESRTQARVEAVSTRRHVLNFPRPWCWFCGLGKARSQSGVGSSRQTGSSQRWVLIALVAAPIWPWEVLSFGTTAGTGAAAATLYDRFVKNLVAEIRATRSLTQRLQFAVYPKSPRPRGSEEAD